MLKLLRSTYTRLPSGPKRCRLPSWSAHARSGCAWDFLSSPGHRAASSPGQGASRLQRCPDKIPRPKGGTTTGEEKKKKEEGEKEKKKKKGGRAWLANTRLILVLHITEKICLIFHVIYGNFKEPKLQSKTMHTEMQAAFALSAVVDLLILPLPSLPFFPHWKLNVDASAQCSSEQDAMGSCSPVGWSHFYGYSCEKLHLTILLH